MKNQLRADTRQQHLVVVYTKADMLVRALAGREALLEYVRADPADALKDVARYVARMRHDF